MKKNKKSVTAVEWLIELIDRDERYSGLATVYRDSIEFAKEMEKQQIIDTWNSCAESLITEEFDTAEQYYNETYNKE